MASNEPEHRTTTEARAASTPHVVRYVLGFGIVGIVVIFGLLLFVFG